MYFRASCLPLCLRSVFLPEKTSFTLVWLAFEFLPAQGQEYTLSNCPKYLPEIQAVSIFSGSTFFFVTLYNIKRFKFIYTFSEIQTQFILLLKYHQILHDLKLQIFKGNSDEIFLEMVQKNTYFSVSTFCFLEERQNSQHSQNIYLK